MSPDLEIMNLRKENNALFWYKKDRKTINLIIFSQNSSTSVFVREKEGLREEILGIASFIYQNIERTKSKFHDRFSSLNDLLLY